MKNVGKTVGKVAGNVADVAKGATKAVGEHLPIGGEEKPAPRRRRASTAKAASKSSSKSGAKASGAKASGAKASGAKKPTTARSRKPAASEK